jgi:hypothetical protein
MAIIAGIIIAAIAAAVIATTAGDQQTGVPEGGNAPEGRHLTLDLNENLALKENP